MDQKILLIVCQVAEPLAEQSWSSLPHFSGTIADAASAAGLDVHILSLTAACVSLQAQLAQHDEPSVVLFAPDLPPSLSLARDIRAHWPLCSFMFVRDAASLDAFHSELSRAPMIGAHWSLAASNDPTLVSQINQAAHASLRRKRLRTTLDRANVQIASRKVIDSVDYRRLVLSEHYLASYLTQATDAMVGLDADLRVLHWNAGAAHLSGLSAASAYAMPVTQLPWWSPAISEHLQRLRVGQESSRLEMRYIAHADDHSEKFLDIVLSAVKDDSSGFIGALLVLRDVSEKYRLLEQERAERDAVTLMIENQRQRLLNLFDQAPGFMFVTSGPEHTFILVNQAFQKLVGERELLGKTASDAFPELLDQGIHGLLNEVHVTRKPFIGQALPMRLQQTRDAALEISYLDFIYQPIIEPDGTVSGIFCQGNDVTQQKLNQDVLERYQTQLEELVAERTTALREAETALHHSQKLEAIGKLTGGVAHDFNNILQIMGSNLELLNLQVRDNPAASKRIDNMQGAVTRGAKLAAHLLAFARRQPLKPTTVNLGRILRELDDLLRRALGASIEIETVVSGGLWNTIVDCNQLENVILNLALNARDAMGESGKLTLEAGNALLDDLYVSKHGDVTPGQYVLLAISDTGCGMSENVIEQAFEPFFTTKGEGEGTGLGLSMAYGFVKQSEGHIKLYSEPGNGTTIRIYLPRSHQIEDIDARTVSSLGQKGTETILVVEDDLDVQAAVVDLLTSLGYTVLKASDAQKAWSILQSGVVVDLLFTDVVMPGPLRSRDLAEQAKGLCPEMLVLFTSGYTQNAIVHGGRLNPGVELISKPYRREDLARKLRQLFDGRSTGKKELL